MKIATLFCFVFLPLMVGCSRTTEHSSGVAPQNPSPVLPHASTPAANSSDLQGFGLIREFGGGDTAAMFGLLAPPGANLQITKVRGPSFLHGYAFGVVDAKVMEHVFLRSSHPMSQQERMDIAAKYRGAHVIYFQGYNGRFCTYDEVKYEIGLSGTLQGSPFRAILQFIALPSSTGDCSFHEFITMAQN